MSTVIIPKETESSALGRAITRSLSKTSDPRDERQSRLASDAKSLRGSGFNEGYVLNRAILRQLDEYAKLSPEQRKSKAAKKSLKEAAKLCEEWLSKNHTPNKDQHDLVPEMKELLVRINKERDELRYPPSPRDERQEKLRGAFSSIDNAWPGGTFAEDRAVLKSLEYYNAIDPAQKNSTTALVELKGVVENCENWLKEDRTATHPMRSRIEELLATAKEERDALVEIREAVSRFVVPKGKTCKPGETYNSGSNIKIKRPDKDDGAHGLGDTCDEQVAAFSKLIEQEVARSNVFAEMIVKISQAPGEQVWYISKNSCGCIDSPESGAIDMSHFEGLPDNPEPGETHLGEKGRGKKVGVTKGEILMHVFEERYHMFQRGAECCDYTDAHNHCLSPGSFQNRYRREMGIDSDSILFDPHDHNTKFRAKAHDGVEQWVSGFNPAVVGNPEKHRDHKIDPGTREFRLPDGDPIEPEIEGVMKVLRNLIDKSPLSGEPGARNPADFDRLMSSKEMRNLRFLIEQKFRDDTNIETKVEDEFKRRAAELKTYFDTSLDGHRKAVTSKNEAAMDHLSKPPASPGSKDLAALRANRKIVNDCHHRVFECRGVNQQHHDVNCAVTTLGALGGLNSTQLVQWWIGKNGKEADKEKYAGLQDQTMWYRVEQNQFDAPLGDANALAKDSQFVGDAQLRGIRALMSEIVKQRNEGKNLDGSSIALEGAPYQVIQDGINDHGGLYPWPDLVKRMTAYPDGTQFQVFVYGDLQHWLYAEKYNGKLCFEDYQTSSTGGGTPGKERKQNGYLVEDVSKPEAAMPHHPSKDYPNAFEAGMYLAITPTKLPNDSPPLPEPKTSKSWPAIGSPEDKAIQAFITATAASRDLKGWAEVLKADAHQEMLKSFKCDGKKLGGLLAEAASKAEAASEDYFSFMDKSLEEIRKVEAGPIANFLEEPVSLQLVNARKMVVTKAKAAREDVWFKKLPTDVTEFDKIVSAIKNETQLDIGGSIDADALLRAGARLEQHLDEGKRWDPAAFKQAGDDLQQLRKLVLAAKHDRLRSHLEKVICSALEKRIQTERKMGVEAAVADDKGFEAANPEELANALGLVAMRDAATRDQEALQIRRESWKREIAKFEKAVGETWEKAKDFGPDTLNEANNKTKDDLYKEERSLKDLEDRNKALVDLFAGSSFAEALKNVQVKLREFKSALTAGGLEELDNAVRTLKDPVVVDRLNKLLVVANKGNVKAEASGGNERLEEFLEAFLEKARLLKVEEHFKNVCIEVKNGSKANISEKLSELAKAVESCKLSSVGKRGLITLITNSRDAVVNSFQ